MVTASKIPVPEPMAPRKSAKMDSSPMQMPPVMAAVGMYLSSSLIIDFSLCPKSIKSFSVNCLARSLELELEISIQILEKNAQEVSTKTV